jgi:hypothetical protein
MECGTPLMRWSRLVSLSSGEVACVLKVRACSTSTVPLSIVEGVGYVER